MIASVRRTRHHVCMDRAVDTKAATSALRQVRYADRRMREAERLRQKANVERAQPIREAQEAGLSLSEIAPYLGRSRERVRQMARQDLVAHQLGHKATAKNGEASVAV
jgi:Sigma-70, region 4